MMFTGAILPVHATLREINGSARLDLRGSSVLLPGRSANRRGSVPGVARVTLGGVRAPEEARRSRLQCASGGAALPVQRFGAGSGAQSCCADRIRLPELRS